MKTKNGAIEIDELIKIIIGLVLLLILVFIVSVYIRGGLDDQLSNIARMFRMY